MEHSEFLERVAAIFERLHLPYFITGSSASIYYGEQRYTSDVDIVVERLGLSAEWRIIRDRAAGPPNV